MARLPFFRRTFRLTRHQPDIPRDVTEEIDFHLDMRTEELIDQGLTPEEARKAALATFGDRHCIEAECRRLDEPEVRRHQRGEFFASVLGDVRRAFRDMGTRPGFTLAVCLTLAVCIALNTAVFSVVHSIVLKPLPYPHPERIVAVWNAFPKADVPRSFSTPPDFFDRREGIAAFEEVALYQQRTSSLGEPGAIRRTFSLIVTPSFFRVLGVEARLGRTFLDEEMEPGNDTKVVLSHGLWQEFFAGDPEALGQELKVEGIPHTVVGVLPEGFDFPGWEARVWFPLTFSEKQRSHAGRLQNNYDMLARLHPGATVGEAQNQLDALNAALLAEIPQDTAQILRDAGFESHLASWHNDLVRHVKPWLFLLWGGALFVLLISAVSLTNLLLVRSTGRVRELAVRHVLGAGRGRLLRQLLTESLVLALAGGGLGILVGTLFLRLSEAYEAYDIPRVGDVELAPWAAALILLLAVVLMAAASLVATLALRQRDLSSTLRAGSSTSGRGHLRLRGGLTAVQIAVACVLLVGATLMVASLRNLLQIDLGFRSERVLAGAVSLPAARYPELPDQHRFLAAMLDEIRSLPGVSHAATATQLPFSGMSEDGAFNPEGFERKPGDPLLVHIRTAVSPEYFAAMEIPLRAGRTFDDGDDLASQPVVMVSEEIAHRYWGGPEGALGQRVSRQAGPAPGPDSAGDVEWHTVVGVVGEIVQNDLTDGKRRGAFYVPMAQSWVGFTRLVVKTEAAPRNFISAVRERIVARDPELVLFWVTTLEDSVASSLIPFRVPMQLLLVFAGIALLLAAVGVYGVLAQGVVQRSKEISIRIALGSSLDQIFAWVLQSMLLFVVAGLAVGLGSALSLGHLMRSLLYEVRPTDPRVFLVAFLVIGAMAFLAAMIPARRATRIDPVKFLTSD